MSTVGPFNLLAAETGIVARLVEATQQGAEPWARKVATKDFLSSVVEENQLVPAVYVVYGGMVVFDADEQRLSMGHRWLVVLAVGTAADMREAAPRNQDAGPRLGELLVALQGFKPPGSTHGLVPVQAPPPHYSEGGKFAYYPLAFVSRAMHSQRFGLAGAHN